MKKTLFIFLISIGDGFTLRSLVDTWCAHTGTAKSDVVILLDSCATELDECAYSPEGYTACFYNLKYLRALSEQHLYESPEYISAMHELVELLSSYGVFYQIIHIDGSVRMVERFVMLSLVNQIAAKHKRLFMLDRPNLYTDAELNSISNDIIANFDYDSVQWISIYDKQTLLGIHPFEYYAHILQELCVSPVKLVPPQLHLPPLEIDLPKNSYVVISLSASVEYRKFTLYKHAKVIERLLDAGLSIVIAGGPVEVADQSRLLDLLKFNGTSLEFVYPMAGKTSLSELLCVMRDARFSICNDTCVPNMAHALGLRQLVIGWNKTVHTFFPYPVPYASTTTRVLWAQPDCPACNFADSVPCSYTAYWAPTPCMEAICVGDVLLSVADWVISQ